MKFSCIKKALAAVRTNPNQMPNGLYRPFTSHPQPKRPAQGQEGAAPRAPKFRNQGYAVSVPPPTILSPCPDTRLWT